MKLLLICVVLVLVCSVFAEGEKKTQKRGVFGLGYGGYGHGLGFAAIAPAPLSHISQVSYSAAHYTPVVAAPAVAKVGYAAAPPLAYGHGLGYAAAPAAIVAAPALAKIGYAAPAIGYAGHGFEYAAPAYAAYSAAPAYAKIDLGYGYHH